MQLNPKHLTVNELLSARLFRIPEYQRAYAWKSAQRTDLFNDIEEVATSGQDHFMATIVALTRDKRRIGADEYQAVDVVDGQQRLTTIIVLLKAIEKSLNGKESLQKKIKREIAELLVKDDEHSLVLLQTNHDSTSVFTRYIRKGEILNGAALTDAEQNLVDAETECEAFVGRWSKRLVELVAILRNRLSVVYHEITNEAAVYRVFEVLNSRGLDVKWIDKLKSKLMWLIFNVADTGARSEAIKEMHLTWQAIYEKLGMRIDLGDEALRFAGTWRSSKPNRIVSEKDAAAVLAEEAGSKLVSIAKTAEYLKSVVDAVYEVDNSPRLRAVTRVAHARFLAVAIMLRQFPKDIQAKLMRVWEKVSFRVFGLGGADTRHKVGDYVRLAYSVIYDSLGPKAITDGILSLGAGYSIDEVLEDIDWSESYNGWTEELRYLLFRYDEHLAREAGEKLNDLQWAKIWNADPSKSIEHIQPQSTNVRYVHELGNLTMLPPGLNSSLRDKPPKVKAPTYATAGLRATARVGAWVKRRGGWSERDVRKRTEEIEKFVREEWAD